MTKALRKAIMTRSRWKNAYLKTRNSKSWENYKKFLHKLTQKKKSEYFHNLNIRDLNDNKKFWKKTKPFRIKVQKLIIEKNELITDSSTLGNLLNNYFCNITSSEEVKKVIISLNKKKSAISFCIPVKVLIDSVDTY